MRKVVETALLILVLGLIAPPVSANCMGEIEGPLPNQIGTIMLFSSRGGGARHQGIPSEFWAVTGRYDIGPSHVYPVKFTDEISRIVDTWNWIDLSFNPPIITVLVDAEFEGEHVWITVRELLLDDSQIEAAYERYPEAKGRCPPLFGRR